VNHIVNHRGRMAGKEHNVDRLAGSAVFWWMLDDEGMVKPQFRERVAAARRAAQTRNGRDGESRALLLDLAEARNARRGVEL